MIGEKTLRQLEFDKVLEKAAKFSVLNKTREAISALRPETDYNTAVYLLDKTDEAFRLLYNGGVGGVEFFDDLTDEPERAARGGILSFSELLRVARLLRAARITASSVTECAIVEAPVLKGVASLLYYDRNLENSIFTKILSDTQMADDASPALFAVRRKIKDVNEKIRVKLQNYMQRGANKYLQDNVVSVREGRYVIPVKSEYITQVKGFIHDRSISGSTFFVEPQEILDYNNELRAAKLEENAEIEKILYDLSGSVGTIADKIYENVARLTDIDLTFSKAQYAHSVKGSFPKLNSDGYINIIGGRHPLIPETKVVPIDVSLGRDYDFIIISGPNTGGKTVTLKLVGLFSVMAMSGFFIPACEGSEISVFRNVFADIGDEQSIEQNLSTFSSHIKNIIGIVNGADDNSLVLLDEIGAGTDPDEGSALALSVLTELLDKKAEGIITTHYSKLKEFAYTDKRVINASMDFNPETYEPGYKLRKGLPGTSNAIEIARRLGLSDKLINRANSYVSEEKKSFDGIIREAEITKAEAEKERNELKNLREKEEETYAAINEERKKLEKDRENFLVKVKAETRKAVSERLERAEEMLEEMKEIFDKAEYNQSDLVKMSTLKNKIENEKYYAYSSEKPVTPYKNADITQLKTGDKIYVKSLESEGVVTEINEKKGTVWAQVGSLRINLKIKDVLFVSDACKTAAPKVFIRRGDIPEAVQTEINVIGSAADEAVAEVERFLDKAIMNNLEEVRIVHGKGLKILSSAIHNYLKNRKDVKSFRFGKYGEGEHGVTIVTLK